MYGYFNYNVMLFRLTNISVGYKHLMNDVFWKFVDDFIIFYQEKFESTL